MFYTPFIIILHKMIKVCGVVVHFKFFEIDAHSFKILFFIGVQLEKFEVHELKKFLTTLWKMRQEDVQIFWALDGNTIKTVNFDILPTSIIELIVMYKVMF